MLNVATGVVRPGYSRKDSSMRRVWAARSSLCLVLPGLFKSKLLAEASGDKFSAKLSWHHITDVADM